MVAGTRITGGQEVGLSDGLYEELDEGCYRRLPTKSKSGARNSRLGWAWNPQSKLRDRIYEIRGVR